MLGDTASIPTLYQMLQEETDENVRVALASSLGHTFPQERPKKAYWA
jgi:hypothetical protein